LILLGAKDFERVAIFISTLCSPKNGDCLFRPQVSCKQTDDAHYYDRHVVASHE